MLALTWAVYFTESAPARTPQVEGYWQNWVDVSWWDNIIPGNCAMGCVKPAAFIAKAKPYTTVNYGFTFLTETPDPDQVNCTTPQSCPAWDGRAIYIAKASTAQSSVVTPQTNVSSYTGGLVDISEMCRLARMTPENGPKRCKICLGGWSDWTRIGSVANAQAIAKLVGKMVLLSFADGIDLDFEHLSEFSSKFGDEFEPYKALVTAIRAEFSSVVNNWKATAQARLAELQQAYAALPDWQKAQAFYYTTNIQYLQEIAANPPPYLEISYTTRFNAWVDPSNEWNFLDPDSPVPKERFETDNEGAKLWSVIGNLVDTVNIMAYDASSDAGPLKLNFEQILQNFVKFGGVHPMAMNMGFEPGDQAGGAEWEGLPRDLTALRFIRTGQYGGAMIWSVNPDSQAEPAASQWCPLVASNASAIVAPSWPFGTPPKYSKVDPTTGWLPQ